jgi:hypothetical protein
MDVLKDRRVIVFGGAALALVAGLVIAIVIAMRQDDPDEAPPASQGGLMVQTGRDDDVRLDPLRPLRCFVNGQFIGQMPVNDCAKKNGVATGALDVGIDSSGALSAAKGPSTDVIPLPPPAPTQDATMADADQPISPAGEETTPAVSATQACWRYEAGTWTRSSSQMGLNDCIQELFAGDCVRPGAAAYGRWGDRTLRLVVGRVEVSSDNRTFRPLAQQQGGCAIPAVG